jgi:TolB protein
MKLQFIACMLLCNSITMSQPAPVGDFQNHTDIGNPKVKGSATYNNADQSYDLKGGGYNIWFNRDEFQYAYSKLKGDFILTANVKLLGEGKENHRKIGWMVRASDEDNAAHISAALHGDGLTVLKWRRLRGA